MKRFIFLFVILLIPLTAIGLVAAASSNTQQPFTAEELDKFINDVPSMGDLAATAQQDLENSSQTGDAATGMSEQMRDEFTEDIQKKGWDPDRFYYIYGHVMSVMSYLQMERLLVQVNPMIAQAQAMIQNSALALPPEQKNQMLREMAEQMAEGNIEMKKARVEITKEVPASEIKLIKARQDEIQKSLGGSSY